MNNTEQQILIDNQIPAILSYPADLQPHKAKVPAMLLLHGFASDKNEVNDFYKMLASSLRNDNMVSLRIDFRGYGESAEGSENSSIDTMKADAKVAFDYLSQLSYVDSNSVGMVGFSLGAAIAMLTTNEVDCKSLVLISPAMNLANDFTTALGKETMEQLSRCDTFLNIKLPWRDINISKHFYQSLFAHDPLEAIGTYKGPFFCVAGEKDFSSSNVETIFSRSLSPNKTKEIIEDADHIFTLASGKSNLQKVIEIISAWLIKNIDFSD